MTIDLTRLREIGWTEWDPIELMRNRKTWVGQPFENEYDHYLIHVADRILAGDDNDTLVSYLVRIECEDMHDGAAESECSRTRAAATVAAIRTHVGHNASPSVPDYIREIVESAMPGWQVVEPARSTRPKPTRKVDSVSPDMATLKAKWFGTQPDAAAEKPAQETTTVVVEKKGGGPLGPKAVVIHNGKIIGMQG